MKENQLGLSKGKAIGWMFSILIPLIIWLIPASGGFTPELRMFFVITMFVILIMAFELLPVLVSAVLLPALWIISGIVPSTTAFNAYTNTTVWMILGGLIFSNVLDNCGLLTRIAYGVIRKCGGTYTGAVFGCFFVGIILNVITFCNGWIVTCALVYGVCKAMNLKPGKESALLCFAGTVGSNGTVIMLYHPGYVSLLETSLKTFNPDYTMGILTPFMYNFAYAIWCIIAIVIMLKVYQIKKSNVQVNRQLFDEKYRELGPMSKKEKVSIIYIVVLLAYLCSTQFTGLPAAYGFLTIPYIMFLPYIGVDDGSALKRTNLPMIFFIATCMSIGSVGSAVGFGDWLTSIAVPILDGKSVLFVCVALLIFGMLAKFFMTPLALFGAMAIPFAQVAITLGISPVAACMLLLYSSELIFMPYQSSGSLIMYSYGQIPMKEFIKQFAVKNVLMIVGFVVVMYPMWSLLGLI